MMRLKNIILVATLGISASVFGQKWFAGPEIGGNFIQVEQSDLGTKFQPGFHGGGNVEYKINSFLSVRAGVFATQKRQSYNSFDSTKINLFGQDENLPLDALNLNLYTYKQINGTFSQFYLEIPLMASYTYKRFSAFGGGYAAYLLTSRKKEEEWNYTPLTKAIDVESLLGENDPTGGLAAALLPPGESRSFSESSSKTGLRTFDFGLKGGLRYQMDDLGINLNYLYGLTSYQTAANQSAKTNHHYFQLTLNYNFEVKIR